MQEGSRSSRVFNYALDGASLKEVASGKHFLLRVWESQGSGRLRV